MAQRAAILRVVLAVLGAGILAGGLAADLQYLAAVGVIASACAELIGIAMIKLQSGSPTLRLLHSASQALPSVALAVVLPVAMLVAAGVVIEAAVAGGVESVLAARNNGVTMRGGISRRAILHGANVAVLGSAAVMAHLAGLDVIAGTDAARLAGLAAGAAVLAAMVSGVDATLALRRR